MQAYAIFILWTKMIMFKYTESSINVYQTEANKFQLDNLLKYTKSQYIKSFIQFTVFVQFVIPWIVKHCGIKILRRKNET